MRTETEVREEIRMLLERARWALDVSPDKVVGCTDYEIDEILEVQDIPSLPPSLDELLRICGGENDVLLHGLFPGTGIGRWEMITFGKQVAAKTSSYNESGEVFGSDRVVFRTHPNGTVYWMEIGEVDPPILAMGESSPIVYVIYPRLACNLEQRVIMKEFSNQGRPERVQVHG